MTDAEKDQLRTERDEWITKWERIEAENKRLRAALESVSKLKPRWDNNGEFYKPSDVNPVIKRAREALAATSQLKESGGELKGPDAEEGR